MCWRAGHEEGKKKQNSSLLIFLCKLKNSERLFYFFLLYLDCASRDGGGRHRVAFRFGLSPFSINLCFYSKTFVFHLAGYFFFALLLLMEKCELERGYKSLSDDGVGIFAQTELDVEWDKSAVDRRLESFDIDSWKKFFTAETWVHQSRKRLKSFSTRKKKSVFDVARWALHPRSRCAMSRGWRGWVGGMKNLCAPHGTSMQAKNRKIIRSRIGRKIASHRPRSGREWDERAKNGWCMFNGLFYAFCKCIDGPFSCTSSGGCFFFRYACSFVGLTQLN